MMRKWRQISLLGAIILSLAIALFVRGWNRKANTLLLSREIVTQPIMKPIIRQATYSLEGHTNSIVSSALLSQRASKCTKYHRGGSLRQVVRSYQLVYARYKLKPVTIKYERFDYGAEIQYLGRLKNTGSRFQVTTSLTVGASRDPHSLTGIDYTRIEICHNVDPFPNTGKIDSLSTEDWKEFSRLYDVTFEIQALISKKYPIFDIREQY